MCGADVSFRDVTIETTDRKCDQGCEWHHAPEAWAESWEKSESRVFASEEDGWLSKLAEVLWRVLHVVWDRWKSQYRKIVYLAPHVEKPFNLKAIKSFVPELRSHQVFFVFRDSYVIYICYEHSMYISHIPVSWVCYTSISSWTAVTSGTQWVHRSSTICIPAHWPSG